MSTLVRVQLRGYNEPELGQPTHVAIVDHGDDRHVPKDPIRDNALPTTTQASVAHILNAARAALGLPADAPIMAQVETSDRSIRAGLLTGATPVLDPEALPDTIPGAITVVLNAFAEQAGATLP